MKIRHWWMLFLIFLAFMACGDGTRNADHIINATYPTIQYVGRTSLYKHGVRFAWTGTTVRFGFEGSMVKVTMTMDPGSEESFLKAYHDFFDIRVDGEWLRTMEVKPGRRTYTIVDSLENGPHQIELFKRTEAMVGSIIVHQLELSPGGKMIPPPPFRERQLEFIGNSISCGFGNEGKDASCSFSPETENGRLAYPAICADSLNADFHTIAYSGIGIWKNYNRDSTQTMLEVYERFIPSMSRSRWRSQFWKPHAVIVNLGTNDYRDTVDEKAFRERYLALLQKIRSRYPNTEIVCLSSPMIHNAKRRNLVKNLNRIVRAARRAGDKKIHFLDLSEQGKLGLGCASHPSIAQHIQNASELIPFLRELLEWPE